MPSADNVALAAYKLDVIGPYADVCARVLTTSVGTRIRQAATSAHEAEIICVTDAY